MDRLQPGAETTTSRGTPIRFLLQAALALSLGVISGLASVAARRTFVMLEWFFTHHSGTLPDAAAALSPWRRALIPMAGALCAWAILKARDRWGRATPPFNDYVEAVREKGGHIAFSSTLWRTLSSAFSIGSGATVGREGSMIQFATAAVSFAAGRLGTGGALAAFPLSRQVACGAAAGVAVAYQAPVAGVFFAAEIVLGGATLTEYPLLAVASVSGWMTSKLLLESSRIFPAPAVVSRLDLVFQWGWLWLLGLAAVLGALGPAYQWLIGSLRQARRLPVALFWGGAATGLLSLARPEVWGNGDRALTTLVHTTPALVPAVGATLLVLLLRLCASTVCVGVGTVGGVFTPTLFAGAAVGLVAAHLIHAETPLLFVLIGMGSLIAAVTHAPLMATFMTVELTGRWELLPAILVCNLIAWQIASRISGSSLYGIATTVPTQRSAVTGARRHVPPITSGQQAADEPQS